MYVPSVFEQDDVRALRGLIRRYPFATLVTRGADGLDANHLPMLLVDEPAPFGTLRAHVARANPLLADIGAGAEALAVFHGPQRYISPSWYATKRETGRVVPTWNFAVVHASGILRPVADRSWLRAQLGALTAQNEAAFPAPWAVEDAPEAFLEQTMEAIVGVEMVVSRMIGKWKVSQNQPARNREGVVAGLGASAHPEAAAMAELVARGGAEPPEGGS